MIEAERSRLDSEMERLSLFKQSAEAAGAQVEVCSSEADLIDSVASSIADFPSNSQVLAALSGELPETLVEGLLDIAGSITDLSREAAATCAIGLTDAVAGVASSGSVCVPIDTGMGALVSLLVQHQLVVLEEGRLVSRPRDAIEQIAGDFVFVTGPSATADMGALVRGVHGPHSLKIFIVRTRS